jgi:hypothetical protein
LEQRGKPGKCPLCDKHFDKLAQHLGSQHIHNFELPYLIESMVITIDQMKNQIESLQNKVYVGNRKKDEDELEEL